jgi:IS5 family transposase
MMGTTPVCQEQPLFSYHINLERRVRPDHPLRRLQAALDLSFVLPAVRGCYGLSGHVSLDPRVIVKLMVLLFYYDLPSERELLAQLGERLDFLWFLGFDLETAIPDPSVLSKARARWGPDVFEQLFVRTVQQCVAAGLVDGRLLHMDSTIVKANAAKGSVVKTSPELVAALRQACARQTRKLEALPPPEPGVDIPAAAAVVAATPSPAPAVAGPVPAAPAPPKKLPVNQTHVSLTDPEACLARCKNGTIDLTYKEHRAVDDAHGVITAVRTTISTVADGTQLPALVAQHQAHTQLRPATFTVAGDGHYGTASNYLYCAAQNLRPHLGEVSAHLEERGKLPASQFAYEAATDRYRCPQGHYLKLHQHRPEARVYLIEDRAWCAACPLRSQCTTAKKGRSLQQHVDHALITQARQEAASPAGRYSRKRRQHVMEGSFADAANQHGSKRARWRGLGRQQLQGWLICAVQNLRRLLAHRWTRPKQTAATGAGLVSLPENPGQTSWSLPLAPAARLFRPPGATQPPVRSRGRLEAPGIRQRGFRGQKRLAPKNTAWATRP